VAELLEDEQKASEKVTWRTTQGSHGGLAFHRLAFVIFATLIPIRGGEGNGCLAVMITHNGREARSERRMSIQAILNDEANDEITVECPDDSDDIRAKQGIVANIAGDVYSRPDQETPNGRQSPIGLLTPIPTLDFEFPPGIGDIQPGVMSGEKAAARHSASAADAFLQSASEAHVDPGLVTSNKRDGCEAPARLETLSATGNDLPADASAEDWRGDVRTRRQLRTVLGIPEPPKRYTTQQLTPLKPPLSEINLTPAESDSTLSSQTRLYKFELASEPSEDGNGDDCHLSDIPSDFERDSKEECERPNRCVERGIDPRYDPTVIQVVDGVEHVPRACQRSSRKGNRDSDA